MAAKEGMPASALRVLEEALGMDLTAAGDTAEAVAAEGAYYRLPAGSHPLLLNIRT
uniref:Uncharacterized protein n=1 Tax=Ursus maritimus TaxID=29073 RepID=A0A452VFC6_URSMA